MPIGPMVPLTTAANPLAARILAAHLGAEGIVWQLRGNVDGPYPVGPVEVLVPADDLEVARAVVAAADSEPPEAPTIADALDDQPDDDPNGAGNRRGRGLRATILVAVVALVIVFALGRALLVGL